MLMSSGIAAFSPISSSILAAEIPSFSYTWVNTFFFSSPPPNSVTEIMNPVYSPGSSGVPYANAKGIGYPGK